MMMKETLVSGIWSPHEAFYLESMLFCTTSALGAAQQVRAALHVGSQHPPSSPVWRESAKAIVNGVQTVAIHAAALSRYFWPVRRGEPQASRAARLRAGLGVSDGNCLRNRDLRNHLEHFDERLDVFCQELVAGAILPTYVGPIGGDAEVPTYQFRAYYTDVGVFEVLGRRFELQPLLDEIQVVHDRLTLCAETGGRIPPKWRTVG